jgi:hypothetical protein
VLIANQVSNSAGQNRGFASSSSGDDQDRTVDVLNRLALMFVRLEGACGTGCFGNCH